MLKNFELLSLVILLLAAFFSFISIADTEFLAWDPDTAKHAMDVLFFRDAFYSFLANPAILFHPRAFAESYYFKYPFLGVACYPPVYGITGGILNFLWINESLVILTSELFFILGGIYIFRLMRLEYDDKTSLLSVILYSTANLCFNQSALALVDLPMLSILLASFFYFQKHIKYLPWWVGLVYALAVLTKIQAAVFFPLFFLFMAIKKQNFIRKDFLIFCALSLASIIGFAYVMLVSGCLENIFLQLIPGTKILHTDILIPWYLYYFQYMPQMIGLGGLAPFLIGLFIIAKNHKSHKLLLWSLVASFLLASLVTRKEPRYGFPLLAYVIMVAGVGANALYRLLLPRKFHLFAIALLILLISPQLISPHNWYKDPQGYDGISEHIFKQVNSSESVLLMTEKQSFGFYFRKQEEATHKKIFIIRYFQVFSCMNRTWNLEEQMPASELRNFISENRVRFIVVENVLLNRTDLPNLGAIDMLSPAYSNKYFTVFEYAGDFAAKESRCLRLCKNDTLICSEI
jgi:hypothetical protein